MKDKKEKPKYNALQNSIYVINGAWKRDKTLLFIILAQIILTVTTSTVGIFLPKAVVEQITNGTDIKTLILIICAFTLTTVLCSAALSFLGNVSGPKKSWLRLRLCADIMNKTIETDYANTENNNFIGLRQKVNETNYGYEMITTEIYERFKELGINLLGFTVYMVLLISVNPLVLLITAVSAVFGVIIRRRADRWKFENDYEYKSHRRKLWYINNIGGRFDMAKDIRLFAMTKWLNNIYDTNLKIEFDFRRKERMKQLSADMVDCFMNFVRLGISYAYLIWAVINGKLSVDGFVLLFAAIAGFSNWIMGILYGFATISRYSLSYCRIREFFEYPDKFKYDEGEPIVQETKKSYSLEFKNVSFCYENTEEYTLENINITIKAGEKLAIVGLNGAGKTTLVKLLCGFYDPTEGIVLLNGRDIKEFNRKEYYKLFTAVFQDFNILPLSIAENISQLTGADIDREKIYHCLKQADLEEKIKSMPKGIDTLLIKDVNDEAVELSGGETQKFMLARALYKDAPVLILDEPTAALDPIAESRLYEKYNELSAKKTSVYISHRLASTRFCDRIILIDNKRITEQGTHDELMKKGGKYADLFEIQSKYYKNGKEGNTNYH